MAGYTENLNLVKPAQEDFYNVDDFNGNMDAIDEAVGDLQKTRSMKTYTSLNEIGLTAGTETFADITTALPDGSALMVATDANHNMSIYPNEHYGLLVVFKRTAARTMFLYSSYGSGFFYGYYYSVNAEWSGWQSFLKSTGGKLTGDLEIESDTASLKLTDTNSGGGSKIHKNASESADYGTYISDTGADGISDTLIIRREGSTNGDKLLLRIYSADGTSYETYRLYHEGNKPTAEAIGAAPASKVNITTYSDLSQIGLTVGSETIADIATNLPVNSMLIVGITTSNAAIYPTQYGLLTVRKSIGSRIEFEFVTTAGGKFVAFYAINSSGDTWTAWNEVARLSNGVLAVGKGGTGVNSHVDNTYTTPRYRASALVSAETNPSNNGVINWTYE